MNTFTHKINELSSNSSLTETQFVDDMVKTEGIYEIIENESLQSCDFNKIVISGSLFSLTTFKNVTFKACTFFASKIENCNFINCNFIDCKFEFTNIYKTTFKDCLFENTLWDYSPLKKCEFDLCKLDDYTKYFLKKGDNVVTSLPEIPQEEDADHEGLLVLPISKITEGLADHHDPLKIAS